jgi:hypothetical protein
MEKSLDVSKLRMKLNILSIQMEQVHDYGLIRAAGSGIGVGSY